jgi:hypothetical protein
MDALTRGTSLAALFLAAAIVLIVGMTFASHAACW